MSWYRFNKGKSLLNWALLLSLLLASGCAQEDDDDDSSSSSYSDFFSESSSSSSSSNSSSSGSSSLSDFQNAYSLSTDSSGNRTYRSYLSAGDDHYYRIRVSTSGSYTISSSGSTDVDAVLYDDSYNRLTSNNDGGSDRNFLMTRSLSSSETYYIKVTGSDSDDSGYYTINISKKASSDTSSSASSSDGNYSFSTAKSLNASSSQTRSASESLSASDEDYFKIYIPSGARYTISSTSSMDLRGYLYSSSGSFITSDDDNGTNSNFSITRTFTAGYYYLKVKGYSSRHVGLYTVRITPSSSSTGSGSSSGSSSTYSGNAGSSTGGSGDVSVVLTWSYSGSEHSEGPDIDLWVETPNGTKVSAADRYSVSSTGLELDHDDRGGSGSGDGGGPERITFNTSVAALGSYDYGVRWFSGNSGRISYRVQLYNGSQLVGSDTGSLSAPSSKPGSHIKVKSVVLD